MNFWTSTNLQSHSNSFSYLYWHLKTNHHRKADIEIGTYDFSTYEIHLLQPASKTYIFLCFIFFFLLFWKEAALQFSIETNRLIEKRSNEKKRKEKVEVLPRPTLEQITMRIRSHVGKLVATLHMWSMQTFTVNWTYCWWEETQERKRRFFFAFRRLHRLLFTLQSFRNESIHSDSNPIAL